jgi:molybdate transport system substrate-binding protein
MSNLLRGISSMATRGVLGALSAMYEARRPVRVEIESVGGIDAAKRVAAGEAFDVVVLAADALSRLAAGGHVDAGARVEVVASGVAVAVRSGSPHRAIDTEDAVRRAVLTAERVGCSTGPSGVALMAMFERWGIAQSVADRLVQAPPGVSVGQLVARGEADIGFQQLSELLGIDGIDILGPLPPSIQVTTIFAAAPGCRSTSIASAQDFLAFLTSPETAEVKRRYGMEHIAASR